MTREQEKTVHVRIIGRVQGVGFRFWTYDQANRLGLGGWVRNERDGSVEALFSGPVPAVDAMLELCWRGPGFSNVAAVDKLPLEASEDDSGLPFEIRR